MTDLRDTLKALADEAQPEDGVIIVPGKGDAPPIELHQITHDPPIKFRERRARSMAQLKLVE